MTVKQNSSEFKNLPLISIVTPSYNSMPYIKDNIESVRMQNYLQVEHIIIDGGSTDGTVEILKSFPQTDWVSEKDSGQSNALNKGFSKASGAIIGWLNADDTYTPGTFNEVAQYFTDHPETDLVSTDVNVIDKDGKRVGYLKSEEFNITQLFFYNMVKQPTVFMRRRVINQLREVDESLHYVMDYEFWLRVGMANFKFDYLQNKVFANFRFAPGSKSFQSESQFHAEWIQVLEKAFLNPAYQNISDETRKRSLRQAKVNYNLSRYRFAVDSHDRKRIIKELFQVFSSEWKLIRVGSVWGILIDGLLGTSYMKKRQRFGMSQTPNPQSRKCQLRNFTQIKNL